MNALPETTSATWCYFAMCSASSTAGAQPKVRAAGTHDKDVRIRWVPQARR